MRFAFVGMLAAFFMLAVGAQAQTCGASLCPGDSLNAAYQAAPAGVETVFTLGTGDYGNQTIDDEPSKEALGGVGSHVVFEPAPGAVLTAGSLRLGVSVEDNTGPDHLTVRGFTLREQLFVGGNDANDILVENVDSPGFYVNGAQNTTLLNGDWGPAEAPGIPNSKVDGNVANANIRIQGGAIHDYRFGPSCAQVGGTFDCHGEGLFVAGCGSGFVIDGVRFWSNEIYHVFIQPNTACNATIQNSWFGRTMNPPSPAATSRSIVFGGNSLSNVLVRYNSFAPGAGIENEVSIGSNMRVLGNRIGTAANCIGGVSYSSNVWTSGSCSASDRAEATFFYVNPSDLADMDYHLTGGVAVDLVSSTSADASLSTDFDGQARSAPRDAGADEISGSPPPPPPPMPQCSDGLDNDLDGHIDYPFDPGCTDTLDDDEIDPPPPPPPPPVDNPPSAPGNLRVSGASFTTTRCSSVTLAWDAASDDGGVTGYLLYKDGVFIQNTSALSHTFSTNCQQHTYTVEAVDTIGQRTAASLTIRPTWAP